MTKTIPEITQEHLEGKTLEGFAKGLGIDVSRQSIHQWKNGDRIPEGMTLLSVIASRTSEPWAKIWAAECFSVLQQEGPISFEIKE